MRDVRYSKPNPVPCAHFSDRLFPLLVYLLANQRKKLGYAIIKKTEIVTLKKPEMAPSITILVNGKQAKDLRSTEILLQNVGAKDIQEQAVQIWFEPPAEIISKLHMTLQGFPLNSVPSTSV